MWCAADSVGFLLRMAGCTDGGNRIVYLTYAEFSFTLYIFLATCASVVWRWYEPADRGDNVSNHLFAFLCLLIETMVMLCVGSRLYHRRQFREINRRWRGRPVPDECRTQIAVLTAYHAISSVVFASIPAVYTAASETATAGDPFTYPFLDVIPVPAVNSTVYACKYAAFAMGVHFFHVEMCFINTTFIHSVGVLKTDVRVVASTVGEAMADGDERALKKAAACHQQLLTYYETLKTVYAKPILLQISFNCIYISINIIFVIQAIQGRIHQLMLSISIGSSVAGLIIVTIICIYGSVLSNLHDEILGELFDPKLLKATKRFKHISLIMMTKAKIPLNLTVGYIFTINLNLLVKLTKISYSVLNVLLASMKSMNLDDSVNSEMTLLKDPSTNS